MNHKAALPTPIFYGWLRRVGGIRRDLCSASAAPTRSVRLRRCSGISTPRAARCRWRRSPGSHFGLGTPSAPSPTVSVPAASPSPERLLTGLGLAAASVARSLTEAHAAYGLGVGSGVGCAYVPR